VHAAVYEIHTHEVYIRKVHIYEVYARKVHTHETYDYEMYTLFPALVKMQLVFLLVKLPGMARED
jgi:hypothetical protein